MSSDPENQVDFYVISNRVKDGKLKMACRLGNKIVRLGEKVYVYADDEDMARTLDKLMWTYSDTSFIPHECLLANDSSELPTFAPLLISTNEPPEDCNSTVLMSLAKQKPAFHGRFPRVVEIVDADDQDKAEGRLRFKSYQDDGLLVNHHSIDL